MDEKTHLILTEKLLERCGCGNDSLIYSLLPFIDSDVDHFKDIYAHNLKNKQNILDSGIEIFTGKRMKIARGSYEFLRIKAESERFLKILGGHKNGVKVGEDKIKAALSLVSHAYFDTFLKPVHFFIPHSSFCSGQWELWNKMGYLELKNKFNDKEFVNDFNDKIKNSGVWNTKIVPEDFPLIIKRRLLKENKTGIILNPEAMIKAMIIRMGELAKPSIDYEIVDFAIRDFFTYLQVKKYLRVDREIEFLRRLEIEITKHLYK